jgi:tripartite-type tricarboxylate transporter receptor subunit TctC
MRSDLAGLKRRDWLWAAAGLFGAGGIRARGLDDPVTALRQMTLDVVVPYAPGGGADLLGRLVAEGFQAAGQSKVAVVNQPGVAGTVGSRQVAQAMPDGSTWLVSGIGSHVIAPQWQTVSYDPFRDFEHLAILGGYPSVLVVNARKGYLRLQDLRSPLNWASPGAGSHGHLLGEAIMRQLGLRDAVHVPYKGGAMAMNDLLGGHVDVAVMTFTSYMSHLRNPEVRALAVTSARRLEQLPHVPTFAELGLKSLTAFTWFSLSAPRGLKDEVAVWATGALRRLYATEAVQTRLRQHGIGAVMLKPEQALPFMQDEWSRWGRMIASLTDKQGEK